ncbi:MAG: uroporphyrinogen-III synthase [Campylobacterota bacterium]|nr:uroporphyrinogen-III synthase [Campylobacterota bacterium]
MSTIYLLSDKNMEGVNNLPVIGIKTLEQELDLSAYEALIFTSKNAIATLDTLDASWHNIPAYAIAPQTAKVIQKHQGTLAFTGKSGHGNDFAQELIPLLKHKKALYVRGKKVVSKLLEILEQHKIDCDELITYETQCKNYSKKEQPEKNAIIIFSSPSTIECFFKNFTWDESYHAIAIGDTTAQYFPKEVIPHIAQNTSLQACIDLAYTLK